MVRLAGLRRLALALPGSEEGTSYGTPAWRVKGKLFARLLEDGASVVVRSGFDAREALCAKEPEVYFYTDHYARHEMVQVRLARVGREALAEILEQSWRRVAPRRLVAARDA